MTDAAPTDRELEALKVLWDRGEATVRDIADAMNASASRQGEDELAYTTVLSLLQVMEQKGLVDHQRIGKAYVYAPRVERQSTFRRLAGSFLKKSSTAPWPSIWSTRSNRSDCPTPSWTNSKRCSPLHASAPPNAAAKEAENESSHHPRITRPVARRLLSPRQRAAFCNACDIAILKQPAQRLAIAKATIAALFLLAILCAHPWLVTRPSLHCRAAASQRLAGGTL